MKVVILDSYSVTQDDLNWPGLPADEVKVYDRTRPEDTIARCLEADAVLTNKVVFSAETIAALPHLRYIGVLATGYNVVDCEAARERGIVVTNIPAYSTASVAQLVFAHLLNVSNQVAHYADSNHQNSDHPSRWTTAPDFLWTDTPLTELAGKVMGIYGLGAIGSAVARIAVAFGMKVLAVTSKMPEELPPGVEKTEWDTLLSKADVLSLHCPLTPRTRMMINKEVLDCMKPTAILINTGRGPLVDEQAVATALQDNRLAAYCTDVLSTEPPAADNPLLSAPRCNITPHIAWATREARQRLMHIALANLQAFVEGEPVNVVNR
ncbi:MAG: D-2-hydroxyacid dehydrogenase [Bacteroidaceae bacterium]|nr:D-2-hydroxyacid dehydrogenase [Bacteroidaceae bacterium]